MDGPARDDELSDERIAYRPADLALRVGLSAKAIYRAIERGELRAARVARGSRLLIPVGAAEAWLEQNMVKPSTGPVPQRRRRSRSARPLAAALAEADRRP